MEKTEKRCCVTSEIEVEIPANYDRLVLKDKTWYALYGDMVMVVCNGNTSLSKVTETQLTEIFAMKYNYVDHHPVKFQSMAFNSWFDTSTGERIDSLEKIKINEKAGMVFCTPFEARVEARKNKRSHEKKRQEVSRKVLKEKLLPLLKNH